MKKWMKRLGIGLAALIAIVIVAILLIPLFVDVDKYRPQIVDAIHQNINGKAELGKLKLSLWGRIRVEADGFSLADMQGHRVIGVKEVFFDLPFSSILAGAPSIQLKMGRPELVVIKDKKGQLNVMSLMKAAPPGTPPANQSAPGAAPSSLPALVTRAKFGLELKQAHVSYRDEATALTTEIKDLNLSVRDLSMSRSTEIEMWAQLDTRMGKTMTVKGPAKLLARVAPEFAGVELKSADVNWTVDINELEIDMPALFHKSRAIPAHAEGRGRLVGKTFDLLAFNATFHNAELSASGNIQLADPQTEKPLALKVGVKAKPIALKPWSELVPMLKEYELGGTATFDADVSGTSLAPQYRADFSIQKLTAKAPVLKAPPVIDAEMHVVTDKVDSLKMRLKAPGNDLSVTGRIVGFEAPKMDFEITSSGMDLDQWVNFPPPKSKAEAGKAAGAGGSASGQAGKPVDYDSMLAPMRENPVLVKAQASVLAKMAFLKAYEVKMKDLQAKASLKNLSLSIDSFKMGLFSGSVASSAGVNLLPKAPTYRMDVNVQSLDLKEAVASQMALFKNTLTGKLTMKMDATGASLNPEPAKKNLKSKGSFAVTDATFATIDVGKVAAEAIGKAVNGIGGQIPQLKNAKLNPPANYESKYAKVSSDFTIQDGVFSAPNFSAISLPNKGLDLRGNTRVGLLDYGLRADWLVIDTHNMTTARNLTVEQNGVRVEHILAEGNEPVKFPIQVTGTLFEPKPSYTAVAESLGKVALSNVGKAVQGKAKAELQKKAQEQLQKIQAPKQVQDAIQGFGKKLFGN